MFGRRAVRDGKFAEIARLAVFRHHERLFPRAVPDAYRAAAEHQAVDTLGHAAGI